MKVSLEAGVLGLGAEESPTPMLAFGAADGQVHIEAAQGGRRPRLRTKHALEVSCVAISADGRFLSAGCRDRSMKTWDAVSGAEISWARGHDSEGLCTCFPQLHQGDFMMDPRCPVEGHSGAVSAMVFSPCCRKIATGGEDKMLIVWNARSGEAIFRPKQPRDYRFSRKVGAVAFTPDGSRLAGVCLDGVLLVWDVTKHAGLCTPARVLLNMPWNLTAWPWEQRRPSVYDIQFSPDLKRIAGGGTEGLLMVWDSRTGQALRSFTGGPLSAAFAVAFASDGSLAAGGGPSVGVWCADSCILRVYLRGHDGMGPCLCRPTHALVPMGEALLTFRPMMPHGGCRVGGHRATVGALCFSQNGRALASGSDDGTCRMWDSETGALLHSVKLTSPVVSVALGRDWVQDESGRKRARRESFAMGQLDRLGARSLVKGLENEVVRLILDRL